MKRDESVTGQRSQVRVLDEQGLAFVKKTGGLSVGQLYDVLKVSNQSLTEAEVTDMVWRLVEEGRADVEEVPLATKSIRGYLGVWDRNLWFYAVLVFSLMTVLVVYTLPEQFPLVVLRWVLGSVFVLFIPGYVTVEALFPKGRDLDTIERFALSIGLSLALVPLIGLLLNYTPWGIRLTPIVISLAVFTIGLSLAGLVRKFHASSMLER